jgi:histidinol-phosphatase
VPDLQDDLALALRLAEAADAVSLARFQAMDLQVETKPDRTPVTDADRATERAIRGLLAAERPDDAVLGEEYGGDAAPGRQWILDPIDGTTNFLRGQPVWGTLIALAVDGRPVVGVVSAPVLRRRWWAAEGLGSWAASPGEEPRRLAVSAVRRIEDAYISFNALRYWDEAGWTDRLLALVRRSWRDRALGDFWSYMLVAEGALDLAAEHDVKVYDVAALMPIVQEAGGRFTDLDGEDAAPWRSTTLATNGPLHAEALEILHSHPVAPAR